MKRMLLPLILVSSMLGVVSTQLISPVSRVAAAPPVPTLNESVRRLVAGNYVASGVGLRDTTSGDITISGIPEGATIDKAFLYWGMLDNVESSSLKEMSFEGSPITGTLVGSGPDTNWGRAGSFAYRADVTSLVSGNGTYHLTGVAGGGAILAEGATLVVLYKQFGQPFREVIILDGDVVLCVLATADSTISGFHAKAPVDAKTTYVVGDGQSGTETATFTGGAGTATFINPFSGSDGLLWDTKSFVVSSQVAAGDVEGTVNITIGGDCLMWVGQVFSVTTDPIADLISDIEGFNLSPTGIETSLVAKLEAALASIDRSDQAAACGSLESLINAAQAQSGKKLTTSEADQIISAATEIKSALNCP